MYARFDAETVCELNDLECAFGLPLSDGVQDCGRKKNSGGQSLPARLNRNSFWFPFSSDLRDTRRFHAGNKLRLCTLARLPRRRRNLYQGNVGRFAT